MACRVPYWWHAGFSRAFWAGATTLRESWKTVPALEKREKAPIISNQVKILCLLILQACVVFWNVIFEHCADYKKKVKISFTVKLSVSQILLHKVRTNRLAKKKAAWMIARRTNVFRAHRRELLFYLTMVIYCSPDSSCFFGAYYSANPFIQSGIIIEI